MALTFTRQALDGSDLDAWAAYEQAQNHLSLGLNTSRLYISGTTLYLRKGLVGFYDGSTYGVITNDADATLSVAGLTVSTWARVEIAVIAGVPVITLTSVAASGTDLGALITTLVGAYDAAKGGFYVSATKRLIGVVKINAAGNPIWAVNMDNALWRFGQEIGAAELTVSLPTAVTFQAGILNLELEFVKLDSAAGEWELDASGAETFFYPGGTSGGLWVGRQYQRARIRPVPGGFLFVGGNLQVVALEPDIGGGWHQRASTLVNAVDPTVTTDILVTASVPTGSKMIKFRDDVLSGATAGRKLSVKGITPAITYVEAKNPTTAITGHGAGEVALDGSKQFYYAVDNADVSAVSIVQTEYQL
jgi:hypothetical protein